MSPISLKPSEMAGLSNAYRISQRMRELDTERAALIEKFRRIEQERDNLRRELNRFWGRA